MDTAMWSVDAAAHANVRVVRRLLTALTAGDVVGRDEFVSPHYRDVPGAGDGWPVRGPIRFDERVRWLQGVLTDLEFEEQELIAVDDRVVVRGVMRGRHVGPLLGVAPTGRCVEIPQVHIFRLADGKVLEHREIWSEMSLLLQLGFDLVLA